MEPLRVFVSWSGPRSHEAAKALSDYLQRWLQSVQPWLSSDSIRSGTRWFEEVADALSDYELCIAVLTADNLDSRWIHFETGAIAKELGRARVIPYLVGVESAQVGPPLGHFHALSADKSGTRRLVADLNELLGEAMVDSSVLDEAFESTWIEFDERLQNLPAATAVAPAPPTTEAALETIAKRLEVIESAISKSATPRSETTTEMHELWAAASAPGDSEPALVGKLEPGVEIVHKKWGLGTVTDITGSGEKEEVTIDFQSVGDKTLLTAWAPLRTI